LEFPSAVQAVESAVEIQHKLADVDHADSKRVELRIGVNLGDIMIEDGDVFGDGVNVAARLEGLAQPGSIYLSSAAYDQVRDKVRFDFDDLGEHSLRNICRPVHVFRLTKVG